MTYPYNTEYKRTLRKFHAGEITESQAFNEIMKTEEAAYKAIPDAEPDGDITYGAALACAEIRGETP